MMNIDKFAGIESKKPKNVEEKIDPYKDDAETQTSLDVLEDELERIAYKDKVHFRKNIRLFVYVVLGFLFCLFFVILPLSEMNLEFKGFWQGIQNYFKALIATGRTALIALATIAVQVALKWAYDNIIKPYANNEKKDD